MTTTKTRTPKPSLCLLMTEKREHGYLHIYGRVVTQRYAEAQYHVEGPDDRYSDGPLYSGLQLRCQGDEDSRRRAVTGERDAPVYGFECEYHDVFSINRRDAVRMAKTLTQLEAKLSKLDEKRGRVHTYGEYVGRVAEALGCAGVVFERTPRGRDISGERWYWETIGSGVSRIDRMLDAWVDEARPKPAEVVEVAS